MGKKLTKTYIIFAFHATLARELRTLENFWHDEFINENSELINGEQHIDDQSKNNLKEKTSNCIKIQLLTWNQ